MDTVHTSARMMKISFDPQVKCFYRGAVKPLFAQLLIRAGFFLLNISHRDQKPAWAVTSSSYTTIRFHQSHLSSYRGAVLLILDRNVNNHFAFNVSSAITSIGIRVNLVLRTFSCEFSAIQPLIIINHVFYRNALLYRCVSSGNYPHTLIILGIRLKISDRRANFSVPSPSTAVDMKRTIRLILCCNLTVLTRIIPTNL